MDREMKMKRPSEEMIARFGHHDVAKISDSMGRYGTLKSDMKPLDDTMRVCGPAFTVSCQPGSPEGILDAIRQARPGDVIVADAQGMGDLVFADAKVYRSMKKAGVAGLIVDGGVSDRCEALQTGIPVFAIGASLRRLDLGGAEKMGQPICCSGMVVYPGDIIVGDSDGVVVIPAYDLERVIALTDAKLAKELYNRNQLETTGVSPRTFYKFEEKMDKWRDVASQKGGKA